MKKQYSGLTTKRMTVVCESSMMVGSNQKIKAKTKNQNWKEEIIEVEEFGLTDIQVSDITTP